MAAASVAEHGSYQCPPTLQLIRSLGEDFILNLLGVFCSARDILTIGQSCIHVRMIVLSLPVSISRFPLGCRVRVKDKETLLRIFDNAHRGDLTEVFAERLAGLEGIVIGRHPSNGIGVLFHKLGFEMPVWFEPLCLLHTEKPPPRDDTQDKRLFPGQKVAVNFEGDPRLHGQVGTVELAHALRAGVHTKVLVRFAGQVEQYFEMTCLTPTTSFFGMCEAQPAALSLDDFYIGCPVQILDKAKVLFGFDLAGRDDYFHYMDTFCLKPGIVDVLHATNGVRVQFASQAQAVTTSLWYEPPCLKIMKERTLDQDDANGTKRRLLVGQRVRLTDPSSSYHGRVGLIQLHFEKRDYTKVTVRFADGHEVYVPEQRVALAGSFF